MRTGKGGGLPPILVNFPSREKLSAAYFGDALPVRGLKNAAVARISSSIPIRKKISSGGIFLRKGLPIDCAKAAQSSRKALRKHSRKAQRAIRVNLGGER